MQGIFFNVGCPSGEGIDLAEMEGPEDALIEEISDAPEVIIEDVDEDIDDDIIDL